MCTQDLCFEQEKNHDFSSENYHFYSREKSQYIANMCYCNVLLEDQMMKCKQLIVGWLIDS